MFKLKYIFINPLKYSKEKNLSDFMKISGDRKLNTKYGSLFILNSFSNLLNDIKETNFNLNFLIIFIL